MSITARFDRLKITIPRALKAMWAGSMRRKTTVTCVVWFVITFSYCGFFSWIQAATLGFGGVFTMTTVVLAVGVLTAVIFRVRISGRPLEEIQNASSSKGLSGDTEVTK